MKGVILHVGKKMKKQELVHDSCHIYGISFRNTEYWVKYCPKCGKVKEAPFPKEELKVQICKCRG
jgi:hypothetical protein